MKKKGTESIICWTWQSHRPFSQRFTTQWCMYLVYTECISYCLLFPLLKHFSATKPNHQKTSLDGTKAYIPWAMPLLPFSESSQSLSNNSFVDPEVEIPRRATCSRSCWIPISRNALTALIFSEPFGSSPSESLSLFLLTEPSLFAASENCLLSLRVAESSLRTWNKLKLNC